MASSQNKTSGKGQEQLFAEVEGSSMSFGKIIMVLLALVLVFGGFYVFSLAFSYPDAEALMYFCAGLAAVCVGFIMAFTTARRK